MIILKKYDVLKIQTLVRNEHKEETIAGQQQMP